MIPLVYPILLRTRWGLLAVFAYVAVLAVLVRLLPGATPDLTIILCTPLCVAFAIVAAAFTFGTKDLAASDSGYPPHMLVMPVSTAGLVAVPMVCGGLTLSALWLLLAGLVLRPAGIGAALVWPAVMLAAQLAWLQALSWAPFPPSPFGIARSVTALLTVSSLTALAFAPQLLEFPSTPLVPVYAVVTAAAFVTSVKTLSLARRGDGQSWPRWLASAFRGVRRPAFRPLVRRPFRSPAAAQFWYEFRRNTLHIILFTLLMTSMLLLPLLLAAGRPSAGNSIAIGNRLIPATFLCLGLLVATPLLYCFTNGPAVAKPDFWSRGYGLPAFFAVRPLPTATYVLTKLAAAAAAVALAWLVVVALIFLASLRIADPTSPNRTLFQAFLHHPRPAALVAATIFFVFITWRGIATGLYVGLTGRGALVTTFTVAALSPVLLLGLFFWFLRQHPALRDHLLNRAPVIVPAVLIFLSAVKLTAAAAAFVASRRRNLIPARTAAAFVASWATLAVFLFARTRHSLPPTTLVPAIILLIPLFRLAAAPLALHWNRHR